MFEMNNWIANTMISNTQYDCNAIMRAVGVDDYTPVNALPDVPAETNSKLTRADGKYRVSFYKNGTMTSVKNLIPCVTDVRSYNDRVVVVTFSDGTEEKAVLHPDDTFSLETGVSICLAKKLVGGGSVWNKMVAHAMKQENAESQREAERVACEMRLKNQRIAKERRVEARKKKRERKQINMMTEAITNALTAFVEREDANE